MRKTITLFHLSFFLLLFFVTTVSFAQERIVSGTVKDNTGKLPLPGTTIQVKETGKATTTDVDGNFRLSANDGQTLVFSFIGYVKEEVYVQPELRNIEVFLFEDVRQLSEIVVTGALGIERSARELGTASQQIDNEGLNQGKVVNPILGLASKVSGFRINMFDSTVDPDVQVNLRGIRSHNGNNAPLYVVDGVPVPDINRINPNDIESINVLKGANAAALYGTEGVNGALIITTKKGKRGAQSISFFNTTTFEQVSRLPNQQNEFGNGLNGNYDPVQYQSWGPRYDGEIRPIGPQLPDGNYWELPYSPANDSRINFFNTGYTTQNDLSFSGGDDHTTYFFSVQDVLTKGIVPGDQNRRTGARLNGSRKFGRLTSSFNANYVFNKNDVTPSEPWATAYRLPANIPLSSIKDWENTAYANPDYFFTTNQANPFFNADTRRTVTEQQTFTGNVEFDYKIADWFKVIYRLGLYNRNQDSRATTAKFTYTTRSNHIAGSVSDAATSFRRINSDLILIADKNFGKFSTRLTLGTNTRTDDEKSTSISASALVVPGLYNPGNRTGELGGSSNVNQYRRIAAYGEFTAGYNNYLFLTFTGRQESVSVLSENNRSYFYPGVSTSFILTDAFQGLKNNHLLSFGKVYTSYNKTGNVVVTPYQLQNIYTQNNGFPFGNLTGFGLGTSDRNPDLKPEFVTSFEIGTQLGLFNNRVHFDMAYVYALTTDGVINADVSAATGYTSAMVNAFSVSNEVVELGLNGDVIKNKHLTWNLGGNFTYLNSQLKEIYGDVESLFTFRQNYLILGEPYNSYRFTDYKRDDQGRIIVDGTTGNPVSTSELIYGGTGTPPYQIGLNTLLTYKNITIGAQFDWRMGAVIYSEAAARMISDGTSPLTTQFGREPFIIPNSVIETAPGVYEENTSVMTQGDRNYWANFVAPVQSNYAVSGDFFKLRELNINYSLPSRFLSGQNLIQEVNVGFIARNLFSIWAKDNIYNDPEFVYRGGSSEGYLSWRHLPPTRVMGFNVNVRL